MNYYIFTNIVLIFFIGSIIFFLKNNFSQIENKTIIKMLLFSFILTLIYKFHYSLGFLGLEYEDSYIFNFSARQLALGIYSSSFLTDGIVAGSLNHPIEIDIYGGHFITYPTLISWFYKLFGYSLYIPSYINTTIEFFTIFILSISFKTIFNNDKYWYVPGILYSLSPIMNVFATTQLSETFSSFTILLTVMSLFYFFKTRKTWDLLLFGIFFFTALMTKRENTVIFNLIFIFSLITAYKNKWINKKDYLPIVISVILIIIYLLYIQNIFLIEKVESVQISTNTFRFLNLISLIPIFMKAYFNFSWYLITPYLFILSIFFFLFKINIKYKYALSLIVLYFSYLLIYTIHYRSYYFVSFNKIDPFEALRYMNNFYIILTLIISFFLVEIIQIISLNKIAPIITSALLLLSMYYTFSDRKHLRNEEWKNRFSSPVKVLQTINNSNNYVIITDVIIVFQLLGNEDLNLIDLNYYKDNIDQFKGMDKYLFLTKFGHSSSFQHRYKSQIQIINNIQKKKMIRFSNNDVLYMLK